MLVLSRKANESITIDCGIEIKVIAVNGNRVKIGIKAPESVHILRTELLPTALNWSENSTEDSEIGSQKQIA